MPDWVTRLIKTKGYNPDQPRDPAGVPTGGRWTQTTGPVPSTSMAKIGKNAWRAGDGAVVEGFGANDPRREREGGGKRIGVIRIGDQEVDILADEYWDGSRYRNPTTADRDQIIEGAIGPWLGKVPAEDLRGLEWVKFSGIDEEWHGKYVPGGPGIMVSAWNKYRDNGNMGGIGRTLKHETGHHVWQGLTDDQRMSYARGVGVDITDPRHLDLNVRYDSPLMPAIKRVASAPLARSVTRYGRTNVFEDFADFYRGYDSRSKSVDKSMDAMTLWDSNIPMDEFHPEDFDFRRRLLGW